MRWIGIDVGTTHTKALVYDDAKTAVVAVRTTRTPTLREGNWYSHDLATLTEEVIGVLASAVTAAGVGDLYGGLSVASVGEEIVLLDSDLAPIGEAILWHDPRGHDEATTFVESHPPGIFGHSLPHPSFSLFKLLWLRDHRPHELSLARKVVDLGDFVLQVFGGPIIMDRSHASRTALLDLETRSWQPEILEAAGLDLALLPELVDSGTVVGQMSEDIATRIGLDHLPALVAGGHDHFCGAFACGIRNAGAVFLSAGTSEAQFCLTDHPVLLDSTAGVEQGCFVDGNLYYLLYSLPAGHLYQQWLNILYQDDESAFYKEAASTRLPLPSFHFGTDHRSYRIEGLTAATGRPEIMRGLIESVARSSWQATMRIARAAGVSVDRIVAAGHPAKNPLWREVRLRHTGRQLLIADEPEAAAFGAALLAQRAVTGHADPGPALLTLGNAETANRPIRVCP